MFVKESLLKSQEVWFKEIQSNTTKHFAFIRFVKLSKLF